MEIDFLRWHTAATENGDRAPDEVPPFPLHGSAGEDQRCANGVGTPDRIKSRSLTARLAIMRPYDVQGHLPTPQSLMSDSGLKDIERCGDDTDRPATAWPNGYQRKLDTHVPTPQSLTFSTATLLHFYMAANSTPC